MSLRRGVFRDESECIIANEIGRHQGNLRARKAAEAHEPAEIQCRNVIRDSQDFLSGTSHLRVTLNPEFDGSNDLGVCFIGMKPVFEG